MDIRPSPIPGWAWDMIEQVERGEHITVGQITWRTASRGPYVKMLSRARSGKIKVDPDTLVRAIDQWERRSASQNALSSGHSHKASMSFTITAGTDARDQRMVVLHEIAHLLAPYGVYHERAWVKIAARLYIRYGGPETITWAIKNERRGGAALKRLLIRHQIDCPECDEARLYDIKGLMSAVRGLADDLKAQGVA